MNKVATTGLLRCLLGCLLGVQVGCAGPPATTVPAVQTPPVQAEAPSPSAAQDARVMNYSKRIAARILPFITFADGMPENLPGDAYADVEIRTDPSGLIVEHRLVKSSGNQGWDAAVMRAVEKTRTLPLDVDGRVPPIFRIAVRPK